MSATETKIDAIRDAISQDIERHANLAEDAFTTMEKMNVSPEEYKKANWAFGLNYYVAGYLRRFTEMTTTKEPLSRIENRMRFHAYQQRTKGELGDRGEISAAQKTIAELLEEYVKKFFEA